nr:hypothetical protein [Oscillospiraceae bacterium]
MKPEKIKVELALEVSDKTAASCIMALNVYLRDHPGVDVDIRTKEDECGIYREIHLRKAEP